MSVTSDDPPEAQRTIVIGKASSVGTNNALHTSKYNIITFFPIVSCYEILILASIDACIDVDIDIYVIYNYFEKSFMLLMFVFVT
jgi:hypothetical protein